MSTLLTYYVIFGIILFGASIGRMGHDLGIGLANAGDLVPMVFLYLIRVGVWPFFCFYYFLTNTLAD